MTEAAPIIDIARLVKRGPAPQPFKLARLQVRTGERFVLGGLDAAAGELLIHLVTGAAVPDEGEVRIAGRDTRDVATDAEWLTSLDRFGIVTERAVLLDGLSVMANLALPLTVAIDPLADDVRVRVEAIADEVGLAPDRRTTAVSALTPEERVRVHLGRAIALAPEILLLEHPTARLDARASVSIAEVVRRIADARGLAWLAISNDTGFAGAAGGQRLHLDPATGALKRPGFWRRLGIG